MVDLIWLDGWLISPDANNSQYEAIKSVNEKQLSLYYGIGKYISVNSRNGFWGKGAIDAIAEQLDKELPGLRGFSARNLRNMRTFYEEWRRLDSSISKGNSFDSRNLDTLAGETAKTECDKPIWQSKLPNFSKEDARLSYRSALQITV